LDSMMGSSNSLTPFSSFVQSRSILKLWTIRMLVKLGAGEHCSIQSLQTNCIPPPGGLRKRQIQSMARDSSEPLQEQFAQRLALTLKIMEARVHRYIWTRSTNSNLRLLDETFSLSRAEKAILVLAASLSANDDLVNVARYCKTQVDVTNQLKCILRLPIEQIRQAISPQGKLRRSGLISVSNGQNPDGNLGLQCGRFRRLVTGRLKSLDQLFSGIICSATAPTLTALDYPHLTPDVAFLSMMMDEAVKSGRRGVNILLYGPPGTGKTELTRVIAKQMAVPLYDVSCVDADEQPLTAHKRLSTAATAQYLLKGRKALLVFDEVDAIFRDGSAFFGKPTTAEQSKAWVNELLEQGEVPTFWIANSVWNMDPAFVRRFDVVIELKAPPLPQRVALMTKHCGTMLSAEQIQRIARVETITPALVSRAVSVMRRTSLPREVQVTTLETLLDGTLKAQNHKTIRQQNRVASADGYDPDMCNANMDLRVLASGVAASATGRICLYGPPGTGKTAFGYWLADQLGKPLMLKRISDIQSPMLGVMERNLAKAFEQASRDGALLQIDEVDSFLRDRREARQSWEVSQTNEFLTQLESYDGVFIASTNLMSGLDPAALRRFDYKVSIGYLLRHQRETMLKVSLDRFQLKGQLSSHVLNQVHQLHTLTPGDFAVLHRQHRITPFTCSEEVLRALANEVAGKESQSPRRIGFV
jgi:transitional endoplasmic reticulum ATPase